MPSLKTTVLQTLGATLLAAIMAIPPARAGDYHQQCDYETIGSAETGGGTYYICRSTDHIGGRTYDHACAFAGGQTWCQNSTRRPPGSEIIQVDRKALTAAEQARRAAIRATQPGGPQEMPLCAGRMTRDGCQR
jgi:hypothetical protein